MYRLNIISREVALSCFPEGSLTLTWLGSARPGLQPVSRASTLLTFVFLLKEVNFGGKVENRMIFLKNYVIIY